jgi:L,D-peptidoglycan transpeptidase YkuD (ErfK/YbiS/YcfS/YnhG family)
MKPMIKLTLMLIAIFGVYSNAFASDIEVSLKDGRCHTIVAGDEYKCSIGKHGLTKDKKEGDGKTPIGVFGLRHVLIRTDRVAKNNVKFISLPVEELREFDGWCDEPTNPNYNKYVNLSSFDKTVSHEELYRKDDSYNIIIVVGYNDKPVKPGKGSAIFIRLAEPNYAGTAGGIGFEQGDLLKILAELNDESLLIVHG